MKKTLALLGILLSCSSIGQINLVPNHSFEFNNGHCPDGGTYAALTTAIPWQEPPMLSTDYFDTCGYNGFGIPTNLFGYQMPQDSAAYAGFVAYEPAFTNYREFAEIKLTDTLISGKMYSVSFYVSRADYSEYALSTISALLSSNGGGMNASSYFTYSPQIQNSFSNIISDTANWTHICDTIIGNGTEAYLTIGNFSSDTSSNVVYVGPSTSSTYAYAYYYLDNVNVNDIGWSGIDESTFSKFSLYPNPSNGEFQLRGTFTDKSEVHVFDVVGNEVTAPISISSGEQSVSLHLQQLSEGIYFYRVISRGEIVGENRLVILR